MLLHVFLKSVLSQQEAWFPVVSYERIAQPLHIDFLPTEHAAVYKEVPVPCIADIDQKELFACSGVTGNLRP